MRGLAARGGVVATGVRFATVLRGALRVALRAAGFEVEAVEAAFAAGRAAFFAARFGVAVLRAGFDAARLRVAFAARRGAGAAGVSDAGVGAVTAGFGAVGVVGVSAGAAAASAAASTARMPALDVSAWSEVGTAGVACGVVSIVLMPAPWA